MLNFFLKCLEEKVTDQPTNKAGLRCKVNSLCKAYRRNIVHLAIHTRDSDTSVRSGRAVETACISPPDPVQEKRYTLIH